MIFDYHDFCIIISVFTFTGFMNPRGSNTLEERLSTDRLLIFFVLRISLHSFVSECESVSGSPPKIIEIFQPSSAAFTLSDRA